MKNMLVIACLSLAGIGLFSRCNQTPNPANVTVNITMPGDSMENRRSADTTIGRMQLLVLDAYTRGVLSGVSVEIAGVDTGVTNSLGVAEFADVSTGTYILIFQKSGYAAIRSTLSARIDTVTHAPVISDSGIYRMCKLGVKLRGSVYVDDNGGKKPAQGAIVELRMPPQFLAPFQSATANAAGEYWFDSLPEQTTYTLSVKRFTLSGKDYALGKEVTVAGTREGDIIAVPSMVLTLQPASELLVLSTNLKSMTPADRATVVFSSAIDTSQVKFGDIALKLGSSTILSGATFSADRETLYVKPQSGGWIYSQYTLALSLKGVNGGACNTTLTFEVSSNAASLDPVRALGIIAGDTTIVDYNTSALVVHWSRVAGASLYDIYSKQVGRDSLWALAKAGSIDTAAALQTPAFFVNGQTQAYMVLARARNVTSDPDSSTVLFVKDKTQPAISTDRSTVSVSPSYKTFDNLGGALPDTIELLVSLRNLAGGTCEPLDTTGDPAINVKEGGVSALGSGDSAYAVSNPSWRWFSTTSGVITAVVAPDKDARLDTIGVNFATVKDLAGNAADMRYGRGIVRFVTW